MLAGQKAPLVSQRRLASHHRIRPNARAAVRVRAEEQPSRQPSGSTSAAEANDEKVAKPFSAGELLLYLLVGLWTAALGLAAYTGFQKARFQLGFQRCVPHISPRP
jgi:hypothetical protein